MAVGYEIAIKAPVGPIYNIWTINKPMNLEYESEKINHCRSQGITGTIECIN
jgi:hypothetical protein